MADLDDDGYTDATGATVGSDDSDCDDSGEGLESDPATDCDDSAASAYPGATESGRRRNGPRLRWHGDLLCGQRWRRPRGDHGIDYGFGGSRLFRRRCRGYRHPGPMTATTTMCPPIRVPPSPSPTAKIRAAMAMSCALRMWMEMVPEVRMVRRWCHRIWRATRPVRPVVLPVWTATMMDASVHPGATESAADGIDSDCDGAELCYTDYDGDGYRPDEYSEVDGDLLCTGSGLGGSRRTCRGLR